MSLEIPWFQLKEEIRQHHPQLLPEIEELSRMQDGHRAVIGMMNKYTKLNLPPSMPINEASKIYLKRLKEKRLRMTLDTLVTPGGVPPIADFDLPDAKDAWI